MYLSILLHIRLHASLTMEPCVLSLMTAAVCKASNRFMSIPAFVAQNSCIMLSILCHNLSALHYGISSLLLHPMDIIVIYIIRKDILANLTALVSLHALASVARMCSCKCSKVILESINEEPFKQCFSKDHQGTTSTRGNW